MDKLIPVVVIRGEGDADRILAALERSGILCAEITFRTAYAEQAIAFASRKYPRMTVGAGTVISAEQCVRAIGAGAKFIVSPGLSEEVAGVCARAQIPYLPGCVTPTEIMRAVSLGLDTVKFFPAGLYGGPRAIKALSAPFPQVKFVPTGGVDRTNLEEYFALKQVVAVGGSFLVEEALASLGGKL